MREQRQPFLLAEQHAEALRRGEQDVRRLGELPRAAALALVSPLRSSTRTGAFRRRSRAAVREILLEVVAQRAQRRDVDALDASSAASPRRVAARAESSTERKAAKVLPVPVGEAMSTFSPRGSAATPRAARAWARRISRANQRRRERTTAAAGMGDANSCGSRLQSTTRHADIRIFEAGIYREAAKGRSERGKVELFFGNDGTFPLLGAQMHISAADRRRAEARISRRVGGHGLQSRLAVEAGAAGGAAEGGIPRASSIARDGVEAERRSCSRCARLRCVLRFEARAVVAFI